VSRAPSIAGIAGFLVRFALAYGLLMAPWPGWVEAYGRIYGSAAAFLFESANPDRNVRIRHVVPEPGTAAAQTVQDTVVRLEIRGVDVGMQTIPPFGTARSSRYTGYVPTAFAVALVLATPLPWRRRAAAMAWAALLASGFAALMLAIWIRGWFYWQECAWLAKFSSRYELRADLSGSLVDISTWPGPYFIAPVFIWIIVSLRRKELEAIPVASSPSGGTRQRTESLSN
jgi:hypothetical protein